MIPYVSNQFTLGLMICAYLFKFVLWLYPFVFDRWLYLEILWKDITVLVE